MDLLASIAELRKQIEGMDRPGSLPPPGQPLPMEEVYYPIPCKRLITYANVLMHVRLHSCVEVAVDG